MSKSSFSHASSAEACVREIQGRGLGKNKGLVKGSLCRGLFWLLALSLIPWSSVSAFTIISNAGKPAKWPNGVVSFDMYGIPEEFHKSIEESFNVWAAIDGVALTITNRGVTSQPAGSRDGRSTISWVTSNWRNLSFRPPSNALAVTLSSFNSRTGHVIDADIYFNAQNFNWRNVDPEREEDQDFVDVQNIGAHEVGHLLGLDHSSEDFFETSDELYFATMYYASTTGETFRRIPRDDDQRGIRSLYDDGSFNFEPVEIRSITLVETFGDYYIYRITGENFTEHTSFTISTGDTSEWDRVARYRTILSDQLAEVEFNLSHFDQTEVQLVAMNEASVLTTVSLNLLSSHDELTSVSGLNSSSGSGGGGCTAQASSSHSLAWVWMVAGLLFVFFVSRRIIFMRL